MNDKLVFRIILFISFLVLLAVVLLNQGIIPKPEQAPEFAKHLPLLHAWINGTCSVLLLLSLYQIKRKNIALHKKLNITTFVLSAIFLISYVTYHYFMVETKFPADNPLRPVYIFILLSHILLAAIVLPMVLLSFYWGLKNDVTKHRKLTRWSFPIWLYVTITGVVVYLMISPYYSF